MIPTDNKQKLLCIAITVLASVSITAPLIALVVWFANLVADGDSVNTICLILGFAVGTAMYYVSEIIYLEARDRINR